MIGVNVGNIWGTGSEDVDKYFPLGQEGDVVMMGSCEFISQPQDLVLMMLVNAAVHQGKVVCYAPSFYDINGFTTSVSCYRAGTTLMEASDTGEDTKNLTLKMVTELCATKLCVCDSFNTLGTSVPKIRKTLALMVESFGSADLFVIQELNELRMPYLGDCVSEEDRTHRIMEAMLRAQVAIRELKDLAKDYGCTIVVQRKYSEVGQGDRIEGCTREYQRMDAAKVDGLPGLSDHFDVQLFMGALIQQGQRSVNPNRVRLRRMGARHVMHMPFVDLVFNKAQWRFDADDVEHPRELSELPNDGVWQDI